MVSIYDFIQDMTTSFRIIKCIRKIDLNNDEKTTETPLITPVNVCSTPATTVIRQPGSLCQH